MLKAQKCGSKPYQSDQNSNSLETSINKYKVKALDLMSYDDMLQFFVYRDLTPELTRPSHSSISKPNRSLSSEVALRAHKAENKFSMMTLLSSLQKCLRR